MSILTFSSPFFYGANKYLKKKKSLKSALFVFMSCIQNQSKTILYFNHIEKKLKKNRILKNIIEVQSFFKFLNEFQVPPAKSLRTPKGPCIPG